MELMAASEVARMFDEGWLKFKIRDDVDGKELLQPWLDKINKIMADEFRKYGNTPLDEIPLEAYDE